AIFGGLANESWKTIALWAFYPYALAHAWSLLYAAKGGRASLRAWFRTGGMHWVAAESRHVGSLGILVAALGIVLGTAGVLSKATVEALTILGLIAAALRVSAPLTN